MYTVINVGITPDWYSGGTGIIATSPRAYNSDTPVEVRGGEPTQLMAHCENALSYKLRVIRESQGYSFT